ncbi:MAG: hypothetical protein NC483_00585 [Ruminococcus sp.]|nr:hypothetical protein [Ruminococcus sp.]
MKGIVLKNRYIVKNVPKTSARIFKDLKDGDVVEITLELTHARSGDNQGLLAYYPKINGVQCSGIPIIKKLIEKGMIFEEIKG